jgi:hypothetical protein
VFQVAIVCRTNLRHNVTVLTDAVTALLGKMEIKTSVYPIAY